MIKPAYSVSFLLSINIFVRQNVLYFPNDLRILPISQVAVPQGSTFRKKTENVYADAQCINTVRVQSFYEFYSTGYQVMTSAN